MFSTTPSKTAIKLKNKVMKKLLFGLIATVMFGFVGNATGITPSKKMETKSFEISAETKFQFTVSVDEARKYLALNPKATFAEFTQKFLNMKGYQSKEAEAVFLKVYEFAKVSPKFLAAWDYKELIVLAEQIKSNVNAKTALDIKSLVSTGTYNPTTSAKFPWKLIL